MPPSINLSGNWAHAPNPETINYFSKATESTWATAQVITHAHLTQITKQDIENTPALLEQRTTVVHIWRAKMASLNPKIGDYLTDARSVSWNVTEVKPSSRDANGYQRYRLVCTLRK